MSQKILTADLRWLLAGKLSESDKIVGMKINEEKHKENTLTPSSVSNVSYIPGTTGIRLHTESGCIVCHPKRKLFGKYHGWRQAKDFKIGQEIRHVVEPSQTNKSHYYHLGYLTGAIAGDGTDCSTKKDKKGYSQYYVSLRTQDREIRDQAADVADTYLRYFEFFERTYNDIDTMMYEVSSSAEEVYKWAKEVAPAIDGLDDYREYQRGWLAGLFDTDGSFDGGSVRITQYEGPTREYARKCIDTFGFGVEEEEKGLRVADGPQTRFRFLTLIQPMVSRKIQKYRNRSWNGSPEVVQIDYDVEITEDIASLDTPADGIIIDGFVAHPTLTPSVTLSHWD